VQTLREALSALAQEGLVERHQGRGTFVVEHATHPLVACGGVSTRACCRLQVLTVEPWTGLMYAATHRDDPLCKRPTTRTSHE